MGLPVLIGAGVGVLTSALRGKNILKGAALGGALGGVGSGVSSLMNGGTFLEGVGLNGLSGAAGDTLSQGAGGLLGATGSAGTSASLAVPTIAEAATPAISGSIEGDGLIKIGDTFYNRDYFANMSGSPIYTGNGSMLDKLTMGAQSLGSNFSNPFTNGIGIDNLTGAGQIASMYQRQPMQAAPSGRIEVGQAPSPAGFAEFMNQYYPQYKQKRPDLGLLG